MSVIRRAVIQGEADLATVQKYMPANFSAYPDHAGNIYIVGQDVAGWGLDTYVIPRLASGLITAKEITHGR